jgi:TPR repeat protein
MALKIDAAAQKKFEELSAKALSGDLAAKTQQGLMLVKGEGVERNLELARQYYLEAAEAGYSVAQYNLGSFYLNGLGVERDYAQALHWFQLAANQGDCDGQFNVAYMYDRGWGTPQSDAMLSSGMKRQLRMAQVEVNLIWLLAISTVNLWQSILSKLFIGIARPLLQG